MPSLPIASYRVAATPGQAVRLRRAAGKKGAYLAGGTRLFGVERRDRLELVDVTRLRLDRIEVKGKSVSIGATVTLSELERHPALGKLAGGLLARVGEAGSWMTRNAATVGGLVGDGAPDIDLLPALLVLDTVVRWRDKSLRRQPLAGFLRKRRPEALILALEIPRPGFERGAFERLGRTATDVALVSVAVASRLERGRVVAARIAVGGVRPGPRRLPRAEALLQRQIPDPALRERVAAEASREAGLASDHRASGAYRKELVEVLTRRALDRALA
jgi:CO/xanthine dehydrogenase FAD-binding subunit